VGSILSEMLKNFIIILSLLPILEIDYHEKVMFMLAWYMT